MSTTDVQLPSDRQALARADFVSQATAVEQARIDCGLSPADALPPASAPPVRVERPPARTGAPLDARSHQ